MFDNITPESIEQNVYAAMETDIDTREGSFIQEMTAAMALEMYKVYTGMRETIPLFYVDKTSGKYIDKQAGWYNITRKKGTKAQAVLTIKGTDGTRIPAGTIFTTTDGLQFITVADAVLSSGLATVLAEAQEVGAQYNVEADKITQQYVSIPGVTSVTNTAAVKGGTDPESDESLVNRLDAYRKKPPTSGNEYHYEQWALEVNGVGAARIFPAAHGGGTVKVLIAGPDRKPVDSVVVTACAEHIEKNRPVCVGVTVVNAEELKIEIAAEVQVESKTTPQEVQAKFAVSLSEYLRGIAFERYEIPFNRIAYMLLDVDGVIDYTALTVNGSTDNVMIGEDQVPILGEVVVT
ncbi:baseplate J/gp47 family protein [Hydrogenoanaerobacterium sp.]|uniref:baseplate J/gp47 family protein n=1 Tax=Hydrogenoanaerobacterium sp. TaxID=2953763 RepID=UPI00289E98A3|nr:baseplate J/gp47 family protein [Hydrogenoanaerobacterium sp.]